MSAPPGLTLIPAGAGSGKTYRIKEQLADWVGSGLVRPDRIAAVTFTESAAGELRDRIRTTLMDRGRAEDALRLDQSFISTIHGFGRRLLVEYAFDAGQCPLPRLLAEDEEQLLLRKAIARVDRIEALSRELDRFGYRYDVASQTTDVEQFRHRILTAVHLLRIIGGDVDRSNRLRHCLDVIRRAYGPTENADILTAALRRSAQTLLSQYPDCMRDNVNSVSAKTAVENDHRNLQWAIQPGVLDQRWGLWRSLQALKVFKRDTQLPADYQAMAREVMAAAAALCRHPGPLADALRHAAVLLESAWDALSDFARRKWEKGIIDYTDMIDGARRLCEQPEVLDHLSKRFDCLFIDEFQDTNPLQFALLWKLHAAGIPAFIVGDLKQAIMGFQSADPRLMQSLLAQNPDNCMPLESNWRSQANLMAVINALGAELFGRDYTRLAPRAPYTSRLRPLEAICFEGPGITSGLYAQHVAARVKAILEDDQVTVFDRHLKKHRRVRGEDIAILGLTHSRLKTYADALRALGIRARLAQDGWFESRAIQLAYYGLSFVADPQDRHAALYLAVTELGDDDLTSAIRTLVEGRDLALPLLQRLHAVAARQVELTVDEIVSATLDAMQLFDRAAVWPEANQTRANLLRLVGAARDFVGADREALAGGGFYGSGLKTFLAWLGSQLEGKDGDRQPDAQVHDEDAVQMMTWHAAKGKEWPIVVVATVDRNVGGRLPSLDIAYTDFEDLNHILGKARLAFSPLFAARETNANFKAPLDEKAHIEGRNLLYVALTRAREQLILEWPRNLQNSSRFTYWHLLRNAAKVNLAGNKLVIGPSSFPCRVTAADREPPLGSAQPMAVAAEHLPQLGRRALKRSPLPKDPIPLFVTPSRLHGIGAGSQPRTLHTVEYGRPLELAMPPGAERGLLIHRILELRGQGVSKAKVSTLLASGITDLDWLKLTKMATAFLDYVNDRFLPLALHWEVPIISRNRSGSVIGGTVDLVVQTKDGYWIVDHKSDLPEDLEETFNHYLPQLKCYEQALAEGLAWKVIGVAIHWACMGLISSIDAEFK